ncbi:ketose-bisphosphate aldolase [Enterococcus hirae EnGen0127]|uniref:class II fructose-bisphosphate aldolase n=1 Tax=Enterococcus hirae TaxID=1354 RepID=UPI0003307F98|nr:class II fructose-bisphosphate aldolase [Enterococcus hirae]EOF55767.1 ketose-bisphosphate aldolase [Enterococcus hirae EnGen0127]OWW47134.1 fructose-bisphosphate aldolase [Enterococcus hirae 81-15-F4]OWW62492.1 fructose-bisphosphate aldolase [Enterococcus hirae 88-15-E09]
MLVTTKEMFEKAQKENYAIPAANFFDLDFARTFVEVAEKMQKPLILAFAQAHIEECPLEEAALIATYLAKKASVPVALHLDHGQDEEIIKQAIELGFTSVMIDASQDEIETNIRRSKAIAEYAHERGVVVEAEIGHVGTGNSYEFKETTDTIYTEVEEAARFAKETGVDSLAVSIGTAHGQYKGTPKISFERLEEIKNEVSIPLVLHGGSSSGDENLHKCAVSGINKINIFTDFITAAMDVINEEKPEDYFTLKRLANQAIADTLSHYYEVFATK